MTSRIVARAGGRSARAIDPVPGHHLAAGRLELRDERRRHGGRTATGHRPADRVGVEPEDQPEAGAERVIEAAAWSAPRCRRRARAPRRRRTGRGPGRASSAAPADRTAASPADVGARGRPAGAARRRASRHPARAARTAAATRGHPRPGRRPSPPPTARARPSAHRRAGARPARPDGSSSTPRAARSIVVKNGEASVSGRIVEHMSWRNPGRVRAIVRVPPPAHRPPRRHGPSARHGPA